MKRLEEALAKTKVNEGPSSVRKIVALADMNRPTVVIEQIGLMYEQKGRESKDNNMQNFGQDLQELASKYEEKGI